MHFQHDEFRVRWQTPVRWDLNGAFCCCFHHGVLSVFVPRPDEDRLFERPRRVSTQDEFFGRGSAVLL